MEPTFFVPENERGNRYVVGVCNKPRGGEGASFSEKEDGVSHWVWDQETGLLWNGL